MRRAITLQASSKYDAKKQFYMQYPKCQITKVEEISDEDRND